MTAIAAAIRFLAALAAALCLLGISTTVFGAERSAEPQRALLEAAVESDLGSLYPQAAQRSILSLAREPTESEASVQEGLLPLPDYSGDWRTREFLSGDWGGTRNKWARKGVTFDFHWLQVAQGIVDGGVDTGWTYVANLDYYATVDLMRMKLVPGAMVSLRAQSRFGRTVNTDTGLLLPVNTFSAFPFGSEVDEDIPLAITELNYMQFVSEKLGFLLGKITTMKNANEFAGGEGRTQFMNFQFIYSGAFAQLAPYSTLAAGVLWTPSAKATVTSILMNTEDASTTSGFSDIGDGASWWTSVDYRLEVSGLPGGGTVGVVYAFDGDFARIGGINFDPGTGISLTRKDEAWALYWSAWQYVYVMGGSAQEVDPRNGVQDLQGVGLFLMLGLADESTNPATFTAAVGVGGRGVIAGRGHDTFGVGYFYNDLQDPRPLANNPLAQRTQGLEAYYNLAIARAIALTFDFQWTESAFRSVDDAIVVAARLNVRF
jgi:porin